MDTTLSRTHSHTKEKPFKCNFCDFEIATSSNLKTHLRIHTGEKPYRCDQCDYASVQAGTLRKHMKIHS